MLAADGATALIKHRVCTLGRCSRDSEAVFVACNASVTYSRLSKNLHGCHQDKTHLRRLRRPPSHRRWLCGCDAGRSQWRLGVSARCVFRVSGSQMPAPTSAVEKRHQGPGTIGTVDRHRTPETHRKAAAAADADSFTAAGNAHNADFDDASVCLSQLLFLPCSTLCRLDRRHWRFSTDIIPVESFQLRQESTGRWKNNGKDEGKRVAPSHYATCCKYKQAASGQNVQAPADGRPSGHAPPRRLENSGNSTMR